VTHSDAEFDLGTLGRLRQPFVRNLKSISVAFQLTARSRLQIL